MQIEVRSCGECPFIEYHGAWFYCAIDKNVNGTDMPINKVHPDCPLKKESVTVKLKEESNDTSN